MIKCYWLPKRSQAPGLKDCPNVFVAKKKDVVTWVSSLSVSCHVTRLSGHPRPSFRAPVHRGCPAWTHRCATVSRMSLWQRANPLSSWVDSCCSVMVVVFVFVVVKHAHGATENTYKAWVRPWFFKGLRFTPVFLESPFRVQGVARLAPCKHGFARYAGLGRECRR